MANLRPNMGVAWYLFSEMFTRFWMYFVFLINIIPFFMAIPTTVFFRHRPLFAVAIIYGTIFVLKPFSTMGDSGFCLCLLLNNISIFSRVKRPFLTLIAMTFNSIMLPLMWYLWHIPMSGNANFFYFQALGWMLFNAMFIIETARAAVKVDKGIRIALKYTKKIKEN